MPSYSTFLSHQRGQVTTGKGSSNGSDDSQRFGRVWEVVLDDSHPKWKELGYSQAQYGVFYTELARGRNNKGEDLKFAYCKAGPIRRVPVRNEIVTLVTDVCTDIKNETNYYGYRTYWTDIVPVWNHVHLNAYPDKVLEPEDEVDTGEDFKEKADINPLQLCPGDMTFEGRHGESIRLGGTQYSGSKIATEDRNGSPYIIFRCGQGIKASEGSKTIFEDINKDSASIYIASGHKIGLEQANSLRNAWKNGTYPEKASEYEKPQIIFNASRLWLNARDTDVEVSAKDSVGVNAGKNVSIDAGNYIGLDAKKIYLGSAQVNMEETNKANIQPILRGQITTQSIDEMYDAWQTFFEKVSNFPPTTTWESNFVAAAKVELNNRIRKFRGDLPNWHSKKSFVE